MGALVVFESMYGNTRTVAEAIADGVSSCLAVEVVEVGAAALELGDDIELLIVGAPTHAFGLSREATRAAAAEEVGHEVISAGVGLREWLARVQVDAGVAGAAFDTHVDRPRVPGSAAVAARRRLRRLGVKVVVPAESFYVHDKLGPLADGEIERARAWGERLGKHVTHARV